MVFFSCLLLILFCSYYYVCIAEITEFHQHIILPDEPEFWTLPKFAKTEVPNWSPGNGKSYIDLSGLKFSSKCSKSSSSCTNSSLDILMFQEPDGEDWSNQWPLGEFCCTNELVLSGDCKQVGRLIHPSSLVNSVYKHLSVRGNRGISLRPEDVIYHHDISETGVYIILMAACDADAPAVVLNGRIDSLDPYGYLPADQFANLPFYGLLSLCYTLLAFAWIVLCVLHRSELIILQYWITGVLAFGLLETAVEYAYFLSWNDSGLQHVGITIAATVFGVCKRALSRIVIQFVALGYGIVRPSLGDDLHRVIFLGSTYFLLSLIYTLSTKFASNSATMSDPEYNFLSLVILMLAGVDTTFYIWTITSINNLLVTLAARKLVTKYLLYRNFRYVLFVSLFFTFVWVIYGSIQVSYDGYGEDSTWKTKWTVDALWELTYFILFLTVCVLWAPYKNNARYEYSYELASLEEDEEWRDMHSQEAQYVESAQRESDQLQQQQQQQQQQQEYITSHGGVAAAAGNNGGRKKYLLEDDDEEGGAGSNAREDTSFLPTGALDASMAIMKKN